MKKTRKGKHTPVPIAEILLLMLKAGYNDKERIVAILSNSFDENKSVNYIIKQDKHRETRIKRLMEYSFEVCFRFGKVFLSEDRKGCALILLPDKKRVTPASIFLDLKLIVSCLGLGNLKRALSREARIKQLHPKIPMYYLWFIGVDQVKQNTGIGSKLLSEIIHESELEKRVICLETSTLKNLPWYQKFEFAIYHELDLGYNLFFLKRDVAK